MGGNCAKAKRSKRNLDAFIWNACERFSRSSEMRNEAGPEPADVAAQVWVEFKPQSERGNDVRILMRRKNRLYVFRVVLRTDRRKNSRKNLHPAWICEQTMLAVRNQILIRIDHIIRTIWITCSYVPAMFPLTVYRVSFFHAMPLASRPNDSTCFRMVSIASENSAEITSNSRRSDVVCAASI